MTDSRTLLAEYAQNGAESAFRELVARYIDLVYSTALRQIGGDAHLAEDVAQTVFLALARKARSMPRNVMLGGWLHQTTRKVASTLMRGERRRQLRESEAAQMNALQNDTSASLEQVAPIIDEAIDQLPDEDRTAVLLRFFEKQDYRSVGEALGGSEDAARMRVNRALDKLGLILRERGVTISATALGATLAAEAVVAAPSGLAATVAASALTGVGAATTTTLSAIKIMAISKLQLGAISAVAIGGLTTALIVQRHSLDRLRDENHSLQRQVQDLGTTNDQLAKSQLDQNELAKLRDDQSELLRLRGEVTVLRQSARLAALKRASANPSTTDASADPDNLSGVNRLQASVRAQVGTGQTLLTGGWASEPGKRLFILASPRIEGENKDQVVIKTKVIEVPEAALAKIGLAPFAVEGSESSLQQILPAEQAKELLDALETTDGAKLKSQSQIATANGRQAQIQTMDQQAIEGAQQDMGPVIDIVPIISGDKTAIDLTLRAAINQVAPKGQ